MLIIPPKPALSRRNFFFGALAAPAIIAIDRLMPVKLWKEPFTINSTLLFVHTQSLAADLYDKYRFYDGAWWREIASGITPPS